MSVTITAAVSRCMGFSFSRVCLHAGFRDLPTAFKGEEIHVL